MLRYISAFTAISLQGGRSGPVHGILQRSGFPPQTIEQLPSAANPASDPAKTLRKNEWMFPERLQSSTLQTAAAPSLQSRTPALSTIMSDFDEQLQKAIERGRQVRAQNDEAAGASATTEEQLRTFHSQLRNELTERIEAGLRRLCDLFPGFVYQTVLNETGWGARISRDDLRLNRGSTRTEYSRLEILVRPFSETAILELATKGTIRNRETLNRTNFKFLTEARSEDLIRIVDGIMLEFAEQYAAQG